MHWLTSHGYVPLLNEELSSIRRALVDQAQKLRAQGYEYEAQSFERLFDKFAGMQGHDYKIVPLTDADRDVISFQ